ncbi:dTDP-4-dehydrorhamnose 3,5-epimerase [candidate division KSB3 bacterium]|uniref:dTDP-4-dehydrorhamnose 3,5-epimerase n=1 Tax=candidate division KSB3 bacterium TaxID=2044937 RepID=A0A2G6E497_9BACT|nr:MAG: dTDP-4-dehydrorhamnose 3,5-epimerase [candidate division KSB3 bacterium]PIE29394.1 MAG: dTDP-4-dehydrorhamnose 3,5-epimerase [candidate division KSB3 bacterium]
MNETRIVGVQLKRLAVIPDERGRLMEILRSDDEHFQRFGQVYMTTAYPGVVKGWHYHKQQTDNMAVVRGMMKLVLYDSREDSATCGVVNEFFFGEHHPLLITIPPFVFHGFKAVSDYEAIVINIPTELYNYEEPDEFRVHPHKNDIPYDWARNDG